MKKLTQEQELRLINKQINAAAEQIKENKKIVRLTKK